MSVKNEQCPCVNKNCPRHGICKECEKFHSEKVVPPACKRKAETDKDK